MKSKIMKFVAVMAVCLATFGVHQAQEKASANRPPAVTNPQVRASFAFCGGDVNCELLNRVRQDSISQYVHGIDGVKAEFNLGSGSRDLTINLITSLRSAALDFSVPVNGGTVIPTWLPSSPVQIVKPHFNILGAYYAKENCPAAATECNYQARMNVGGWKVSGDTSSYAVLWNPTATNRPVNSPQATSYVNVRYMRNDGNGEVYIITPINTTLGYALSGLEQTNRKVVKGAGQYNMPFRLEVRPK